jgi:hypothetical protein
MLLRIHALAFALVLINVSLAITQEIRPGVWEGSRVESLALPTGDYQVYLIGELHGVEETWEFFTQYLALLHKSSGLRDIVLEEKGVYEDQAQAFVDGRSGALPPSLCLRFGILERIRTLNAGLKKGERIRVHFVDVDSPAPAIRQHLIAIRQRIPEAGRVNVPAAGEIKEHGLEAVAQLKRFHLDPRTNSELRTVEYSIRAYQQGFEVGIGLGQGSSYLEDREQAAASNIEDLVHTPGVPSVLLLYGADHVSRAVRKDGGPDRNQPFSPMALRLQQAGLRIFGIAALPLSGMTYWRGHRGEVYWSAQDVKLHSGETFDKVLASAPRAKFFYIDMQREHAIAPSYDLAQAIFDGFVFFPSGTPMKNRCAVSSFMNKPRGEKNVPDSSHAKSDI